MQKLKLLINKNKINIFKKIILFVIVGIFIVLSITIYILIKNSHFSEAVYEGGYAPNGDFCEYGYSSTNKECCQDDDYSCEEFDMENIK